MACFRHLWAPRHVNPRIQEIRKMHELQEEYLVVVNYDVKSFVDLVHLKFRLERVDKELCKIQKEMYRDRASQ